MTHKQRIVVYTSLMSCETGRARPVPSRAPTRQSAINMAAVAASELCASDPNRTDDCEYGKCYSGLMQRSFTHNDSSDKDRALIRYRQGCQELACIFSVPVGEEWLMSLIRFFDWHAALISSAAWR